MRILITGGAGFIGSNFALQWVRDGNQLLNLDKLTYAGCLDNLKEIENNSNYTFVKGDIADKGLVRKLLEEFKPEAIVHFAAETHVDRSLGDPEPFLHSNVIGTCHLLEEALHYWQSKDKMPSFRFVHVSTDEVYGSLEAQDASWTEESILMPSSPYAASKASADHFVNAYHHTFGLPTIITRCSNNFGPFQFPEKLIPLTIINAIQGKNIPVYGDGQNIRNWIFVNDHCDAIRKVLEKGRVGEVYHVGGENEQPNLAVIKEVCAILDKARPGSAAIPHERLICFVKDRPGHDRRYSLNCNKIQRELGWKPKGTFQSNMQYTVEWYLNHSPWWQRITTGAYQEWIKSHYAEAL